MKTIERLAVSAAWGFYTYRASALGYTRIASVCAFVSFWMMLVATFSAYDEEKPRAGKG